jgi:hypothetical protein
MSECTWVKEKYLTLLCLRVALDPKVSATVRSNFSREKFKGKYEADKSELIPFEDICMFLKKTSGQVCCIQPNCGLKGWYFVLLAR